MARAMFATLFFAAEPLSALVLKPKPSASLLQTWSNELDSSTDTPVTRVVSLLKEMQKGLSGELEEDEDLHNKLKCWCATSDRTSDEQIAADNAKISTLETSISEENARVAQLTEEIDTLEKDIAASKSELSDATAIREKQLAEYREANKATTEDIESLKAAILVLQKHHPNSALPQLKASFLSFQGTPDTSSWTSQEQNVLNRAMKVSSSFVQSRGTSEYVPQYASQSGEVLGVLKQLLEEMNSDIAAAEAAELEHKKAFDELSAAKNEEIAASTQQHKEKSLEAQETKLSSDRNTAELERTQESLGEQEAFLANLNATCSDAQTKYDARHAERLAEIQTIAETIEILMEDQARDHFSRTYNSFIQLSGGESAVRAKVASLLRGVAHRTRSPDLGLLASRTELDSFTKVKAAIDKFVAQLQKEQEDEVSQRDSCQQSIHGNEVTTTEVTNRLSLADASIAKTANDIQGMKDTIVANKNAVQETKQSFHDASLDRAEASALFQKALADQRATERVLRKALDRMAQFYNVFLQQEPPVAQKKYKKHEGGAGVMELLKKIIVEAQELQAESFKAEQAAVNDYGKLVKETHAVIEAKEAEIVDNQDDLAGLEETLQSHTDEKDSLGAELKKLMDENMELHSGCDYLIRNFETRQSHRAAEIEALQQAKSILSGASFT